MVERRQHPDMLVWRSAAISTTVRIGLVVVAAVMMAKIRPVFAWTTARQRPALEQRSRVQVLVPILHERRLSWPQARRAFASSATDDD
jgi:hypothetical protein